MDESFHGNKQPPPPPPEGGTAPPAVEVPGTVAKLPPELELELLNVILLLNNVLPVPSVIFTEPVLVVFVLDDNVKDLALGEAMVNVVVRVVPKPIPELVNEWVIT